MKPENISQSMGTEQLPVQPGPSIESEAGLNVVEAGLETGAERYEQKSEMNAIISDIGLATTLPAPVVNTTTVADNTTTNNNPLVANDDDLIEKEWVDKAKKIVAETMNDPYQRDEAVNRLQVDYLKKRFGRELGVVE